MKSWGPIESFDSAWGHEYVAVLLEENSLTKVILQANRLAAVPYELIDWDMRQAGISLANEDATYIKASLSDHAISLTKTPK